MNLDILPASGVGDIYIGSSSLRMDGPDGYWEGAGQWFGPVDGSQAASGVYAGAQDVFIGHGAYDAPLCGRPCGP